MSVNPTLALAAACSAALVAWQDVARARGDTADAGDVADFDLAALLNVQIEGVSKRAQRQQDIAASIYLLTADDIRRTAATRLQDLLGLLPGVWIGDLSYDESDLVLRDKMQPMSLAAQLLVDDVPITTPMTESYLSSLQDIDIGSIERIELIRGQAGALYGLNAASGVIKIVTKSSEKARGLSANVEAGTRGYVSPTIRFGTRVGDQTSLRVYAKGKLHDGYAKSPEFDSPQITPALAGGGEEAVDNHFLGDADNQQMVTAGLRVDSRLSERLSLRSGGHFTAGQGKRFLHTGYLLDATQDNVRLGNQWRIGATMSNELQAQLDDDRRVTAHLWLKHNTHRYPAGSGTRVGTSEAALELQYDHRLRDIHEISLGTTARVVQYHLPSPHPDKYLTFSQTEATHLQAAAFAAYHVTPTRWLTLAAALRAEIWTLSYVWPPQLSPVLRAGLHPTDDVILWASVGRSNSLPGYIQADMEYRIEEMSPRLWAGVVPGEKKIAPSEHISYETGLRYRLADLLQVDISVFITQHARLTHVSAPQFYDIRTSEADPSHRIVPMIYQNMRSGHTWGGELVVRTQPAKSVRLEASYSHFGVQLENETGTTPFPTDPVLTPEHVLRGRLYWDTIWGLSVNLAAIWQSAREVYQFDYLRQRPAYTSSGGGLAARAGDARMRLSFKVEKKLEGQPWRVVVWGQDVLASHYVDHYWGWSFSLYPKTRHRVFGVGVVYAP